MPDTTAPDTTLLLTAVHALADKLRALPESALRRGAAERGHALAGELVRRAQLLEFPGQPPRELPDAGIFAVGDQLAVAGHDLAAAGPGIDDLEEALALVRAAARELADTP